MPGQADCRGGPTGPGRAWQLWNRDGPGRACRPRIERTGLGGADSAGLRRTRARAHWQGRAGLRPRHKRDTARQERRRGGSGQERRAVEGFGVGLLNCCIETAEAAAGTRAISAATVGGNSARGTAVFRIRFWDQWRGSKGGWEKILRKCGRCWGCYGAPLSRG